MVCYGNEVTCDNRRHSRSQGT